MKSLLLNLLKYASLPFAILYGLIIAWRNFLYDQRILSSIQFSLPVICVGNLTVGGTGKSPHIEFLIQLLEHRYQLATLSRGYKRYTRGFKIANAHSDAREIGDEPYQFLTKYPRTIVCVAEERMTAIPQLLQKNPTIDVILLDDAFQHRSVKAGLNILLSDYDRMYTRDYIMPFGLLRESKKSASRAQIIIVTKCPSNLSSAEKEKWIKEINPLPHQQVYFTCIRYSTLNPFYTNQILPTAETEVLLVTGIANNTPLITYLQSIFSKVHTLPFKDHHYYTHDDIEEIVQTFQQIHATNKIIVSTEKDAARLHIVLHKIKEYRLPIFIQAIQIDFLFDEVELFTNKIESYIYSIIPPIVEEDIVTKEIEE